MGNVNVFGYLIINIAVLGIFGFFVQRGHKYGIIWKLVGLVALLFTLWISFELSGLLGKGIQIAPMLQTYIEALQLFVINHFGKSMTLQQWNRFILFGIIFTLIYGFYFLKRPIEGFADKIKLSFPMAKTFGALFGVGQAFVICTLIYVFFSLPLIPNGQEIINHTVLLYFEPVFRFIIGIPAFLGF